MTESDNNMTKKSCIDIAGIKKEEFVQNYIQYRWLDETRSKLVDRVFIVIVALLLARLQFSNALLTNPLWLFFLHGAFIVVSETFAYSIVRYRRQQRGHGAYISAIRRLMIQNNTDFTQYELYLNGKRVYLTLGIDTAIVIIATFAPFVLTIDHVALVSLITTEWLSCVVVFVLPILLFGVAIWLIVVPYVKYNFKEELDWQND